MAEYTFEASPFNMTSTITYGDFGAEVTRVTGSQQTVMFYTSAQELAAGEVVESIELTSTRSVVNLAYTSRANGIGYYSGALSLDPALFVQGQDIGILFYFCLDKVPLGDGALSYESDTASRTLYFSNVTLTIRTTITEVQLPCPTNLSINGVTGGLSGQQRDLPITLSWNAVDSEYLGGYEVWSCDYPSSDYVLLSTTGANVIQYATMTDSRGYSGRRFKVKAIAAEGTAAVDSALSDETASAWTKFTNVHCYKDGKWQLGEVHYRAGDAWKDLPGLKYYNGSAWVEPGF